MGSYATYRRHPLRAALGALLAFLLSASVLSFPLMQTPIAYADDDNQQLMEQVRSIRASVDSAQAEYLSATQYAEQISAQYETTQQTLSDLRSQLNNKKGELESLMIDEYKSPIVDTFLSALYGATGLDQVFAQLEYANRIVADRTRTTREVARLAAEAEEKSNELEAKKIASAQATEDAQAAKDVWNSHLDEMRPQIKQLRELYFAQVESTSGYAQLESALAYLEDIETATDAQVALLHAAYNTGYAGSNYCERWIEAVYRNAGISHGNYVGASDNMVANMRYDDLESIPVGALVFGSGTSAPYGHVGICVAAGTGNHDALILDNEGSRSKKAVPLSEWGEWQNAISYKNGRSGLFGWGYPDSITLEPIVY